MASQKETTSIYQILEVLFRHKTKVVLIPAVIIAAGLAIALFAPRSYRSEAKLALQVGRQSVNIDPTAATGQAMIGIQQMGREGEVMTAMDLIKSRGVIAKVVDKLTPDYVLRGGPPGSGKSNAVSDLYDSTIGAATGYAIKTLKSIDPISDREEAIIEIEENLVVDAERDSTLILATYSTDTPEGAQEVLTTLIDVYQDEHLRINRNTGSRDFFRVQEKQLREQLDGALEALRLAKNEIGVASIEARRQNLENQLQSITMSAYQAETELKSDLGELRELTRQLDSMPERLISSKKSIPNQGADLMREQLYELQVRQADLKARYSTSHPLVVAISRQVEAAEKVVDDQKSVREETTDDLNPLHRQVATQIQLKQSEAASLDARLEALKSQDSSIRDDLEQLNQDTVVLTQLERDAEILKRKFMRYSDNLEQARIDEELENEKISSISIAQEPTLSAKPVSPSKLLVGLGSLVLAFAGTAATVLGLEQVSDKLRSDRSIEAATGAPVLASIPESAIHGRVLAP